jgi:deoxyhypusine synthase
MPTIRSFMEEQFRHFNAREALAAARAYDRHLAAGGRMLLALGGAMSTAELGVSLARMIRAGKIHAISCTGANLEEDLFLLFGSQEYLPCPNWRSLSATEDEELACRRLNRVTDVCIPEELMERVAARFRAIWAEAERRGQREPWPAWFSRLLRSPGDLSHSDPGAARSWVAAAVEREVPIFCPGFEDSTLGSIFVGDVIAGRLKSHDIHRHGTEELERLARWYLEKCDGPGIGFFQIGGGIAGDFAISVVPMLNQDAKRPCPLWAYFAQISDSTTSYGSYSGAPPNEKITWGKLAKETPRFMIESDATIVAPLIFAYLLEE